MMNGLWTMNMCSFYCNVSHYHLCYAKRVLQFHVCCCDYSFFCWRAVKLTMQKKSCNQNVLRYLLLFWRVALLFLVELRLNWILLSLLQLQCCRDDIAATVCCNIISVTIPIIINYCFFLHSGICMLKDEQSGRNGRNATTF